MAPIHQASATHLHKNKKDELPLTYRDPYDSYSYTITNVNPFKINISDGGSSSCKYFSDIGEWSENFYETIFEMNDDWILERFHSKKSFNQESHESGKLRGE